MKKRVKKKSPDPKFSTIGVRFLSGMNLAKVYSYKVHTRVKVYLGQELVADTPRGAAVVVVVRIDKKPHPAVDDYGTPVIQKFIERKVAPL